MNSHISTWILEALEAELARARAKFPKSRHQLAALTEEVGELAQAMLDHEYGKAAPEQIIAEAIQVAAMAIRVMSEGDATFNYEPPPYVAYIAPGKDDERG